MIAAASDHSRSRVRVERAASQCKELGYVSQGIFAGRFAQAQAYRSEEEQDYGDDAECEGCFEHSAGLVRVDIELLDAEWSKCVVEVGRGKARAACVADVTEQVYACDEAADEAHVGEENEE